VLQGTAAEPNQLETVKMTELRISPKLLAVAVILVATVTFVIDMVTPLGVAGGVPYIAAVLLSLWLPGRRNTLLVAVACTVLTGVGFLVSPPGEQLVYVLANRFLAVFAIWVTAFLGLLYKQTNTEYGRLVGVLEAKNAELDDLNEELRQEIAEYTEALRYGLVRDEAMVRENPQVEAERPQPTASVKHEAFRSWLQASRKWGELSRAAGQGKKSADPQQLARLQQAEQSLATAADQLEQSLKTGSSSSE
jgi:hypothetical protein